MHVLSVALCLGIIRAQAQEAPKVACTVDTRMKWEADHEFAGVVLLARDGKVVFHQAYGQANRQKKIAMRPDTILAIGSTPIDFTKAGMLGPPFAPKEVYGCVDA
jgi:CubicO group peptidase (beta-lactamase class C family)